MNELRYLATAVVVKPFDSELFDLARQDDYAGIYVVIEERILQLRLLRSERNIATAHTEALDKTT